MFGKWILLILILLMSDSSDRSHCQTSFAEKHFAYLNSLHTIMTFWANETTWFLPCVKLQSGRNSRNWFNCSVFVFNCSENYTCACFYEHGHLYGCRVYSHYWDRIDHCEESEWQNDTISLVVALLLTLSSARIKDDTVMFLLKAFALLLSWQSDLNP